MLEVSFFHSFMNLFFFFLIFFLFKVTLLFFLLKKILIFLNRRALFYFIFFALVFFSFLDYKIFHLIYFSDQNLSFWMSLKIFIVTALFGFAAFFPSQKILRKKFFSLDGFLFFFYLLLFVAFELPWSPGFSYENKNLSVLFFSNLEKEQDLSEKAQFVHFPSSHEILSQMSLLFHLSVEDLGNPNFFNHQNFSDHLKKQIFQKFGRHVKFLFLNFLSNPFKEIQIDTKDSFESVLKYRFPFFSESFFLSQIPDFFRLFFLKDFLKKNTLSNRGLLRVLMSIVIQELQDREFLFLSIKGKNVLNEQIQDRLRFLSNKLQEKVEFLSLKKVSHSLPFLSYQVHEIENLRFFENFVNLPKTSFWDFVDFKKSHLMTYCFYDGGKKIVQQKHPFYENKKEIEILNVPHVDQKIFSHLFVPTSFQDCSLKFDSSSQSKLFSFSRVIFE